MDAPDTDATHLEPAVFEHMLTFLASLNEDVEGHLSDPATSRREAK